MDIATSPDVFALPVHPWAAQFPMRSQEDLESMAASIKANGVRVPVVIGKAPMADGEAPVLCLVDGRNRIAACKLAGVTPPHIALNGEDIDAFIADVNLERRDLTKGQKAMLLAVRHTGDRKGGRGKTAARNSAESAGLSMRRVQEARSVIEFCPELVEQVIDGKLGLDEGLKEAQRRRAVGLATETRFERLDASDSDLADLVREQRMSLSEAEAAATDRRDNEQRARAGAVKTLRLFDEAVSCLGGDLLARTVRIARDHPDDFGGDLRVRVAQWKQIVDQLAKDLLL